MRGELAFVLWLILAAIAIFTVARAIGNNYVFFAGYVVLQYAVLATGWNVLGGYCGYVNFGTAAFFALGAYATVAVHNLMALPVPVFIAIGGVVSGVLGLAMGYLTLRLRGAFFSIATLAMAVVAQTLVVNWDFVGGSAGAYVIRPERTPLFGFDYVQYLFVLMLVLSVGALAVARAIEQSRLGYGFAAIRDDEIAAEACGVPTFRLKLMATLISGALMGMAGAPLPFYVTYLDPPSAFNLSYAVNTIAMPLIGGTESWAGPLVGAVLIATLEQVVTVTISSAINLLVVGIVLVFFVVAAPTGIIGMFKVRFVAWRVIGRGEAREYSRGVSGGPAPTERHGTDIRARSGK
jgi:branched-chain amino acid transport system permease protein